MAERYDIAVLGATGFTGRLIAAELRAANVRFAVAGRRLAVLEQLVDSPAAVLPTDLRDARSLERTARSARVLINTVGPFDRFGDVVADAALQAGTHYVDTTAEQAWILRLSERLGTFARNAGLAFVPAQAVDFAPALTAAHRLAQQLSHLAELHVTHWLDDYKPSRGTSISAIAAVAAPGFGWQDGARRLLDDRLAWRARKHPDLPKGYREVPFPGAEPVLLPTELRGLRNIASCLAMPAVRAHGFAVFQKWFSGERRPAPRQLAHLERLIAWRATDPDPDQRARSRWCVVVRGANAAGTEAAIRVSGRDVYLSTARLAAQGALTLAGARRIRGGVGSLASAVGVAAATSCCERSGATFEPLS